MGDREKEKEGGRETEKANESIQTSVLGWGSEKICALGSVFLADIYRHPESSRVWVLAPA